MTDWNIRSSGDDASTPRDVGQQRASNVDLTFKYRREAAELRDTARQLELEAEFYSRHQESDRAKRNLELARERRQAADAADAKARD